jgi:drug/metabolite transporter (DMT)-like permease
VVVALSLAAALVYGAADFCGGLAARRHSALVVVVWSQVVGLGVLLPALLFVPGVPRSSDVAWGIACGISGAFAVGLLYRGLAIGVMGVVSPITAVLAAAIPVVYAVARGERPPPLALLGIALALVAVVLVSASTPKPTEEDEDAPLARVTPHRRFPPGIPEALGAGCAFGFFFIALAQTHADAGLYPLLGTRLTSIALLVAAALMFRKSLRVVRPGLRTIVIAGALDMTANVLYVVAAHIGALSIVAVITSLYPAGTVALAAFVLHERLVRVQWIGVAIAFAGIVCISLAR